VKYLADGIPPVEYKMKTEEEVDKLNNGPTN